MRSLFNGGSTFWGTKLQTQVINGLFQSIHQKLTVLLYAEVIRLNANDKQIISL